MTVSVLIAAFLSWLMINEPQFVTVDAPQKITYELVSNEELVSIALGPEYLDKGFNAWGYYVVGQDKILLREDCDYQNDIYCQSIILHELVHHLVTYSDIEFICPQHEEIMAYELQIDWLEERKVDPWTRPDMINALWIAGSYSCPEGEYR